MIAAPVTGCTTAIANPGGAPAGGRPPGSQPLTTSSHREGARGPSGGRGGPAPPMTCEREPRRQGHANSGLIPRCARPWKVRWGRDPKAAETAGNPSEPFQKVLRGYSFGFRSWRLQRWFGRRGAQGGCRGDGDAAGGCGAGWRGKGMDVGAGLEHLPSWPGCSSAVRCRRGGHGEGEQRGRCPKPEVAQ